MLVQGCNNASRSVDTQALPESLVEELEYTVHLPLMDAEGRGGQQGTWIPTPPNTNICFNPPLSVANTVRQLPPETKRLPVPLYEPFIQFI